jgi:branched-chain amino acid transport system permease protein
MAMETKSSSPWVQAIQTGLLGGTVAVLLSLVGMVAAFSERYIVSGVFTMGQVLFMAPNLLSAYVTLRRNRHQTRSNFVLAGLLASLAGSAVLVLLRLLGNAVNLRAMFINASPELWGILTFGQETTLGIVILLGLGLLLGAIAAGFLLLPERLRHALAQAILWVLLIGLLRDLIVTVSFRWGPLAGLIRQFFAVSGLTIVGTVILFLLIGGISYWRSGRPKTDTAQRFNQQKPLARWLTLGGVGVVLLFLPLILGIFFSEILDNVSMYILMGLGLNIVVGFAGLLDLGYVAFFAIGAYTIGILTSPELGIATLSWWQALPFALLASFLAGFILGLPVLKMRGDYLAIVTLGFGEIVRLLVLSDWLRPWLGGSQGIQRIAQPRIGDFVLNTQQELYYLFLLGLGVVAFIAWRLKDSRLGRAWMALREDEDVAMAMGINHVTTKLLAFATGALFSGLAGAIFAAKLTSVYPHSMNFFISINVLSLIIIGGMGSIPGVFIGALVLIAAPDLLREFAEFRYLVYGALLVTMMLTRPEGLWPEKRRQLELHEEPPAAAVAAD